MKIDNIEYKEPKQSANTLFKFMKKIDYLKEILDNIAIIPRYNVEIIDYLNLKMIGEEIAFPMSCFCDINLTKLNFHAAEYGQYGIGLKKEKLYKKTDVEPIHYINPYSSEAKDFTMAFESALKDSNNNENLSNYISTTLLYMKPIQGYMYKDGEKKFTCFHDEREWRYIPEISEENLKLILTKDENTEDYRKLENNALKRNNKYWLKFLPEDVNYIIVKEESEIAELAKHINSIKVYSDDEKIELISKIIVLENMEKDW